ncbi:AAA domain-containing protein [Pseudonocardia sp. CA-142604]|uniref:AAA domain-containing protein n=1 Tax=Pseudonocardia sp. CA-142604 TaxID=3240024 RepID=UPI003D8E73F7
MTADWSAEVIEAVERWIETKPDLGRNAGCWRNIGPAMPQRDGWLVLDLRASRTNLDALGEPCFAGERGPEHEPAYPVEELRNVDGVLMLREPQGLPAYCRYLWARSMSPRFLLEKLRDGLRHAGPAPLAQALVEKRLGGHATSSAEPVGLLDAQAEAFRACLSPGVRLVWGPPGTGKTLVLARAIEELVSRGKRVLLVSTANVAVDNALHAALSGLPHRPGVAVRVGPAHLTEIAADPDVQLERLAARASREADETRERVAAQLRQMDDLDAEIEGLRAELADYDDLTYRAAVARVAAEREAAERRSGVRAAEAAVESAEAADAAARAALHEAKAAYVVLDPARRALVQHTKAADELARLDQQQRIIQLERDAFDLGPPPSAGYIARRRHQRHHARAVADYDRFIAEAVGRRRGLLALQFTARRIMGRVTAADLDAADDRVARAEAAATAAVEKLHCARHELDGLRSTAQVVQLHSALSDDDRRLVERCAQLDLPARYQRFQDLIAQQHRTAAQRGALEAKLRTLVGRVRRLRADAEAEIVREARVVATTLARSRMHPAIATATFDVVLVDEAGAAALAEVLLALCRARTTAVLFGDFLQLGPVLDGIRHDPSPVVEKWILATCFKHVGIHTPGDTDGRCVALTHQFRFGPELRRLANSVIYDVLRDAHELPGITARPQTEIVLVDVSTVPDLASIRAGSVRGRWWTAGVVLSRALAELHAPDGPVGVVTPYNVQSEATLAALRDRDLVAGTAVGTVHSFQGREYPTLVFDLVDDGRGWVARGKRGDDPWEYDGLKVFGVGITRARRRLYLIGDGRGLPGASTGPFRELRVGIDNGEIRRWSAAAMLGLDEPEPDLVDETFVQVSRLLRQLVTVTDIHDEHAFGRELEQHLKAARQSVWMWSPWIANRAREVVPLIRAAVERGVDVRVFIRPDGDRLMAKDWAQRQLPALLDSGATVIRSDLEHRKIVVIDGQVVLLGSLNVLSNTPGSSRESMITMEGRAFASRLLTELRVDEIGTPQHCSGCRRPMEVRRRWSKAAPLLYWQCRQCNVKVPLHGAWRQRR